MKDFIITFMMFAGVIFLVCSVVGIFRARSDIKKHKNDDCNFRKTRKEVIAEKCNADTDSADCSDVLRSINNLSDEDKEEFKRQLLAKIRGEECD